MIAILTALTINLQMNSQPESSSSVPTRSLITQSHTETQVNSCIEKTCGPAISNVGAHNAFSKKFQDSPKFQSVWENFESKIKTRLEDEAKQGAQLIERIKVFYKERPKIKLSQGSHAFLVWQNIHRIVDDNSQELRNFDLKTNVSTFNEEKFRQITQALSTATVPLCALT